MRTQKLPEKILPFRQSLPGIQQRMRGAPVSLQTWGRRDIGPQSRAGGPRWSSRGSPPVGPALPPPTGRRRRRCPASTPLGPGKLPPSLEGVLIPYTDNLVVDRTIQGLGNKIGPNALYAVRAGLAPGQQGRGVRFHRYYLDIGILLLQIPASTGQSPTRPNSGYKNIHVSICVTPISGPVVW